MDYFVNYMDYGPAEAKILADLMEQTLTPTVSVAMCDLKETLSDKLSNVVLQLVSTAQAELAMRGSQGGSAADAEPPSRQ
jgi:hypothetical protein